MTTASLRADERCRQKLGSAQMWREQMRRAELTNGHLAMLNSVALFSTETLLQQGLVTALGIGH